MIKKVLKQRGKTVVWLASELSCHRTNIYKIFARKSIDTQDLMLISSLLEYDFFAAYSSDFEKYRERQTISVKDKMLGGKALEEL